MKTRKRRMGEKHKREDRGGNSNQTNQIENMRGKIGTPIIRLDCTFITDRSVLIANLIGRH